MKSVKQNQQAEFRSKPYDRPGTSSSFVEPLLSTEEYRTTCRWCLLCLADGNGVMRNGNVIGNYAMCYSCMRAECKDCHAEITKEGMCHFSRYQIHSLEDGTFDILLSIII